MYREHPFGIIPLTKPAMPAREELEPYLERIWTSRQLTNEGPLHAEFEEALCLYLGCRHISLFANGTLALILAVKSLDLHGEVITTPFTTPATVQSLIWNGLHPVFVDIDLTSLNIVPDKIEEAVTSKTSAVLPVHVFGTPCDVDGIKEVTGQHKLKVIYDAAHTFGIRTGVSTLLDYGDLSVVSFNSTKVFHTIEGGAVICHDLIVKERLDALKNLRLDKGLGNDCRGMNASLNELQAAFGLVLLNHADKFISMRRNVSNLYTANLEGVPGLELVLAYPGKYQNHTYFPVIIHPEEFGATRDETAEQLKAKGITTRSYFHPLVSDFPEFSKYRTFDLQTAREVSDRILCLPLYHDLEKDAVEFVCKTIKKIGETSQNSK